MGVGAADTQKNRWSKPLLVPLSGDVPERVEKHLVGMVAHHEEKQAVFQDLLDASGLAPGDGAGAEWEESVSHHRAEADRYRSDLAKVRHANAVRAQQETRQARP